MERRTDSRQRTKLSAHIAQSSGHVAGVIVDISQSGCRIAGVSTGVFAGELVTVRCAALNAFPAQVRWVRDGQIGLQFASAVPLRIVHYFAMLHPAPSGLSAAAA